MTTEDVLAAMTALINQNISLSARVAQLQAENDALKSAQPKEPVIGETDVSQA